MRPCLLPASGVLASDPSLPARARGRGATAPRRPTRGGDRVSAGTRAAGLKPAGVLTALPARGACSGMLRCDTLLVAAAESNARSLPAERPGC